MRFAKGCPLSSTSYLLIRALMVAKLQVQGSKNWGPWKAMNLAQKVVGMSV